MLVLAVIGLALDAQGVYATAGDRRRQELPTARIRPSKGEGVEQSPRRSVMLTARRP
jgi:hypothetical protein